MEEHANNAHNFLFVEEVKNFGHMLNNVKLEICEAIHCKIIVRKNPKSAAHVVCHCTVTQTVSCEEFLKNLESLLINEVPCQVINLEQVHQTVSACISGKHILILLLSNDQVQKTIGILGNILVL